eukprot:TRINITY_DN35089_c0_g1_i1.p1 TRINITY_DN35089_c0_g1~~TRINITY_DN35089_c0_g1_i1.p1  ORF type:complete len:280 (+),score=32.34 TRINITY_DN35089_c0_g1_i1:198-1037(+)
MGLLKEGRFTKMLQALRVPGVQPPEKSEKPFRTDCERGFDIADAMEMGMARELVTDFVLPLRRSSRLWKFNVERFDSNRQYRLFSESGAFLMYARCKQGGRCVQFFLYDPREENSLFDPDRPAFTMSRNSAKTEWRIVQEAGDDQSSPSPACMTPNGNMRNVDQREVAIIRHSRNEIGDGISNLMDVLLCGDGHAPHEEHTLFTKVPEWNEQVQSLVLDFKGRSVLPSAKNFQLCRDDRPDRVVCQYGKLGPNSFGLDFKFPMTVIQAFGCALTTANWV